MQEADYFRFEAGRDDIWAQTSATMVRGTYLINCIINDKNPLTVVRMAHAVGCTLAAIRSAQEYRPIQLREIEDAYTAY